MVLRSKHSSGFNTVIRENLLEKGGGGGRCGPPALASILKFSNKENNKTIAYIFGSYLQLVYQKHTFNYANKFTAWNLERCFYFEKKGKLC